MERPLHLVKQISIRDQLSQMPEKTQELGALFSTSLHQVQSEIIALRVYDVETFLQQYLQGQLPVDTINNVESPRDPGEEGWFFTQAVISNKNWLQTNAFPATTNTFSKEVYESTERQRAVPLQSAFIRHIAPSLNTDWLEMVKNVVEKYDGVGTDQMALQYFILGLSQRFQELDKKDISTSKLLESTYKDPYSKVLIDSFADTSNMPTPIEFFRNACRERAGIVVGFNTNLLTYPYVTEQQGGSYLAAEGELFIKPPQGSINLSCISAIETLGGPYEEELLRSFGINN